MTRLEVRNLPAALIARDLVTEKGGRADGDAVLGDGWVVRFVSGEPVVTRLSRIPVLFIEVDGEREDEITSFLRRKTMRGGG
jgi:hypothetical protein